MSRSVCFGGSQLVYDLGYFHKLIHVYYVEESLKMRLHPCGLEKTPYSCLFPSYKLISRRTLQINLELKQFTKENVTKQKCPIITRIQMKLNEQIELYMYRVLA